MLADELSTFVELQAKLTILLLELLDFLVGAKEVTLGFGVDLLVLVKLVSDCL